LSLKKSQSTQDISNEKYFIERKWILQLTVNPGLALTGFEKHGPGFYIFQQQYFKLQVS